MYEEIEGILLCKLPSPWTKEEFQEIWPLLFGWNRPFNKQEIKRFCTIIKENADLPKYPKPTEDIPGMWVSILLFTSFKKLPLFINHKRPYVKTVVQFRLDKGK